MERRRLPWFRRYPRIPEDPNARIRAELEARREYLLRDDVIWVNHYPRNSHEACLVINYRRSGREFRRNSKCLSDEAQAAFLTVNNPWLNQQLEYETWCSRATSFNDSYCRERADIIAALDRTIASLS